MSPFPRIAVDNSSSVKDRPHSHAARSATLCQRHGIQSRCFHMDTVSGRTFFPEISAKSVATLLGPPSSSMIAEADVREFLLVIEKESITFCKVLQQSKCADAPHPVFSQYVGMAKAQSAAQERAQLEARTLERVKWLESYVRDLREAEGQPITRHQFSKKYLGLTYGAYVNALARGRFRTVNLLILADRLDISMDYICGLTDEMHPPKTPGAEPTIWEMRKRAGHPS